MGAETGLDHIEGIRMRLASTRVAVHAAGGRTTGCTGAWDLHAAFTPGDDGISRAESNNTSLDVFLVSWVSSSRYFWAGAHLDKRGVQIRGPACTFLLRLGRKKRKEEGTPVGVA